MLPTLDREPRLAALRERLEEAGLDALLVTKRVNVRWLTGFTGSAGLVLVSGSSVELITDARYQEAAAAQLADTGFDVSLKIASQPGDVLASAARGLRRVGLEADHITWSEQLRARDQWFAGSEVFPTSSLVERLRSVKEAAEVARIEAAGHIATEALESSLELLLAGAAESEIAAHIESEMRRMGAEEAAFPTIVAAGPNAALPHHEPGPRRVSPGDLVVIDLGASVEGYRSDMTRTFAIGPVPPESAGILGVVAEAQQRALAAVRAGVAAREVDAAARDVITAAGYGSAFLHATGHGTGLEVHEQLRLAATSDDTLAAGHVVTVEPGIYVPGLGGVRIEDTVEVTTSGHRELTTWTAPVLLG